MKIDILTLFPKMFENVFNESMVKIAQKKKKLKLKAHNLRGWARDKHRTADDKPYGGGAGMIMKVEPIYRALASLLGEGAVNKLRNKKTPKKRAKIILLTPRGTLFDQKKARELAKSKHLILICGHYEGVDERVHSFITHEISVGDYVLTGGEIAAMTVVDAVARLIPGVLGDSSSLEFESFENNLLEYPQYTRPREFKNLKVPSVLLGGDHKAIDRWRKKEALKKTKEVRKDLLLRGRRG